MKRSSFASALAFALVIFIAAATSAFAQAQAAAPTTPAPATKAKFVTPIKGPAEVQVIYTQPKFVGNEIVTTYKVKNMSNAPIALLKIDEYWYDKAGKLVSSDTARYRQPLYPGEVAELTTHAPKAPGAERSQATFSHANGSIPKPKKVTKFE